MNLIKYIGAVLMLVLVSACGGGGGNPGASSGGTGASTPLFTSAPTSLILASGTTSSSYSISGGVAPYTVTPDTPSLLSVSFAESLFTIKAAVGNGGNGSVIVLDSIGTKVTVAVTVPAPAALQSTAPSSLSLVMGSSNSYVISGGVGPYTVTSANPALVSASANSASLIITALAATAGGQANVVVTDAKGTLLTITVTVPAPAALQSTAPSSLSLLMGSSNSYVISGGVGPYTATSANPSLVSASANSASLIITALAATAGGQANVVVTDAKGAQLTISVTVPAPAALQSTAPSSLSLVMGSSSSYVISGGVSPYTATSANPALVSASVNSAALTISALPATVGGQANVLVTDAKGAQLSILVTVPAPVALSTTAPSLLTMPMPTSSNPSLTFAIFGGTPNYTVVSTNPDVVSVVAPAAGGTAYTLTSKTGGSATIVISESKGTTVNVFVTVPTSALSLRMPSGTTIGIGAPGTPFQVSGGVPPYTSVSADNSILTASMPAADGSFVLQGIREGVAIVRIYDATGAWDFQQVTVSSRLFTDASAFTTLSIGTTNFITVFGGVPFAAPASAYVVNVSNPEVVRVVLSGNRLSVIGLAKGSATVGISDSKGTITTLQFNVPAPSAVYTDAPMFLSIASGTGNTYTVFGGTQLTGSSANYTINNSDPAVVSAVMTGSRLTIGGLSSGSATLTISDSAGASTTVFVTVTAQGALRTNAPGSLTLAADGLPNTYAIAGGDGPYKVQSDNQLLVTAVTSGVNGETLTITAKAGTDGGLVHVIVTDAQGKQVTIQVTVLAPVGLFTTAPQQLAIAGGAPKIFAVFGGAPPYSVVSTNPAVVSGAISGSTLTITGSMVGSGTIVVSDAKGTAVPITVGVNAAGPLFLTAPGANVVVTTSATYDIIGGVPPYLSSSTDLTVAQATIVNANQVRVNAMGTGTATIAVTDSAGTKVSVGVTVPGPSPLLMYTAAPTTGVFLASADPAVTYQIYGGRPAYTVTSSDTNVVQASLTAPGSNRFTLQAIGSGTAQVLVQDSGGLPVTIPVTVGSSNGFFVAAPAILNMGAGSTSLAPYRVSGGAKPYSVATSDSRVAVAFVDPVTSLLTVTALSVGSATLQVADAIGKTPYTITVVVDNAGGTGPSAAASIDILASSDELKSTPGSTISFIVTVKNGANAALPNQTVMFSATTGTLTGANPAPVTNAAGVINTVTLSPGTDASNRLIKVTATTGGLPPKTISIPVVGSTVSVSGPGAALVGSAPQEFTLKALDSSGKPIGGAELTIESSLGNGLSLSQETAATNSPLNVTTSNSGVGTVFFTATNAGIGTDTLKVKWLGTSSKATVVVSNVNFAFVTLPSTAADWRVSTAQEVRVRYLVGAMPQPGATVNFSTTRGTLSATSVLTNPDGEATVTVSSATAGPVTVAAELAPSVAGTSLTGAFVAKTPATVVLQANPAALLPNAAGSTTNQSALTAIVRDAIGNPVQGVVVNFNAVADPSGGSISTGSATDVGGVATAQFVAGPLSTASNGVTIQATVPANTTDVPVAITGNASLTVNGSALFISIARASTLSIFDSTTYQKDFSVYVTDATGAPAGNRTVSLSVWPTIYGKGTLSWDTGISQWIYAPANPAAVPVALPGSPATCPNEDDSFPLDPIKYRNGILNAGEDTNGNVRLDPGSPVAITSSVTTDALGFGTFTLRYGKNYAWWLNAQITAKSLVSGTESAQVLNYPLEMHVTDVTSAATPPNQRSPFGVNLVPPAGKTACFNAD